MGYEALLKPIFKDEIKGNWGHICESLFWHNDPTISKDDVDEFKNKFKVNLFD